MSRTSASVSCDITREYPARTGERRSYSSRAVPDYLGLLRELSVLEPPAFVFGSVAEGVLLDGAVPSCAGDLDLLVPRAHLGRRLEELTGLGFGAFSVYYEPRPELPMVFGAHRGEFALEVSVVDRSEAGLPYFAVLSGQDIVSIAITPGLFDWPATSVENVAIHTLSPLALFQIRSGVMTTLAFGAPRETDLVRQRRLRTELLYGQDDRALNPVIARLPPS